jgi:hypothetical protein
MVYVGDFTIQVQQTRIACNDCRQQITIPI